MEAGSSVLPNKGSCYTVTLGGDILKGQFTLEFHQIVLIVSNTVFFLGQPNGQDVFDGVFIHQKTVQLFAGLFSGDHVDGIGFPVIDRIGENLGIDRLYLRRCLAAGNPKVGNVFRISKCYLIAMVFRCKDFV